jgi:hypothetical protein
MAREREKWKALVKEVMNLRVLEKAGKLSCGYANGGLSSSAQRHRVGLVIE